jgi:mRNA interferase MazF
VRRGEVYWLDLGAPEGSAPAKRRPVVIVQCGVLSQSAIGTAIVSTLTSRPAAARYPRAVTVPGGVAGLPRDSVLKPTEILTVDRPALDGPLGALPPVLMAEVDRCLRFALEL